MFGQTSDMRRNYVNCWLSVLFRSRNYINSCSYITFISINSVIYGYMYLHQYQVIVVFLNIHISTLFGVHYFYLDMSCALGLAIFGVEIVEHWGSPSFMLRLQYF